MLVDVLRKYLVGLAVVGVVLLMVSNWWGLLAVIIVLGAFGVSVEIFGTEWVDELWDRYHRGQR